MPKGGWRHRASIEGRERGRFTIFRAVKPLLTLSFAAAIALAVPMYGQVDLVEDRKAMVLGDVHGVIRRLSAAIEKGTYHADPLENARALELLGEQYHRISDIGHAKELWDEALHLRQRTFGDSSAEAATGYAYRARYHNYMAAPQVDHQGLALQVATCARNLSHTKRGQVDPLERVLILREYGYAFKVAAMTTTMDGHVRLKSTRSYFREALRAATAARDTVWMAQVLHDIGNTFTDAAGWDDLPVPRSQIVDSALFHYARSIELMTDAGYGNSGAVMMDHYTTALVYHYAYRKDSLEQAINAFDEALRTLLRQAGNEPDVDPLRYDDRITDPAQMLELHYQRAKCLFESIEPHTKARLLDKAIAGIEAAVPYWEQMLRSYQSTNMEKVTGSYSHFPFRLGSELFLQRYRLRNDARDLHRSVEWSELNRTTLAQRKSLRSDVRPSAAQRRSLNAPALKAPPGTIIIVYNHFPSAFVIDENGLSVTHLQHEALDLDYSGTEFREFAISGQERDPIRFAAKAFRMYQQLLGPILEGRIEVDLVLVPYGSMALLPFEALCTSTTGKAWNDLAYLGRDHHIRYARSIAEALGTPADCLRANALFATVSTDSLAPLPFAQGLARALHAAHATSVYDHALSTADMDLALSVPGLLHIATHGVSPTTPDDLPFLLLADGPWSTEALRSTDVKRTLAILSACSSGRGRTYQGDGVMSLAHAFLNAGAQSAVHTLWPVDDRATSEIISSFHEGLEQGLPASSALQQAKVKFIQAHATDGLAAPFYWSGIVLTGRDVFLERSDEPWWPVILAVALLTAGAYSLSKRSKRSRARVAS